MLRLTSRQNTVSPAHESSSYRLFLFLPEHVDLLIFHFILLFVFHFYLDAVQTAFLSTIFKHHHHAIKVLLFMIIELRLPFPQKHHDTQTVRARELKFWKTVHPHHVSHVMCHMSCVTCHVSGVMCCKYFLWFVLFKQRGEVSCWWVSVC